MLLHELWRDEAWLWLAVTGSRTVPELLGQLARSGQGSLFPALCLLASRLSPSPRALQALHLLVAAAAAWAFARWAPFGRLERGLVLLGYFPFYEYAVLSRHYAAGALLLWLACAAARSRRPALGLGASLGLLCQTTVYGIVLAAAVACGFLAGRAVRRGAAPQLPRGEAALGALLALGGAVAGLMQVVPLPGTSFAPGWRTGWDAEAAAAVLASPWRALVPLPRPGLHFWNSNVLDGWPALLPLAGVLALALAVWLLGRSPAALAAFATGAAGLLAFSYLKYLGLLRHQGHLWLLLLAALWLGAPAGGDAALRGPRRAAFVALLSAHVAAGAFASAVDVACPFSNGAATAVLIRTRGLDRYPLLGHREPPAATVALYLGRPLYSPSRRLFATHPDWGPEQRETSDAEVREAARDLACRTGSDVVLVTNHPLPPWPELVLEGSCTGAIHPSEDYHLSRLVLGRLAAPGGSELAPSAPPR